MSKIDDLIKQAKRIVCDAPMSVTFVKANKYTKQELIDIHNKCVIAFEKLYDILENM